MGQGRFHSCSGLWESRKRRAPRRDAHLLPSSCLQLPVRVGGRNGAAAAFHPAFLSSDVCEVVTLMYRNMRISLFLGAVVFFALAFAHHEEGHHEDGDDHHDPKHGHDDKGEHHDSKHDLHHNESLARHKIAPYNSKFAFDLYQQVARDHPDKNMVLSPISISTAFAFLALAAKGQTHSQIIEGLRFNTSEISEHEIHSGYHHLLNLLNDAERELTVSSGNALFISKEHKILQTFLDEAKRLYRSEAFSTDFTNAEEAKKQINSYVEKNTHGKIPELLDSVDQDAIFVLINYIYFRGKWEHPFEEKYTKEGDFRVNENTTVKVPFMTRTGMYQVSFNDDATVVSIPYKGDASALFIMPNVGKFAEVERNFHRERIMRWKNAMHRRWALDFVDRNRGGREIFRPTPDPHRVFPYARESSQLKLMGLLLFPYVRVFTAQAGEIIRRPI